MPSISNRGPDQAASLLADDHSEINILIGDLLAGLEEEERSKAFARLDMLWARLAVHIRAEHLCLFPSILEANFTSAGGGPTYQEAQNAIDQLRLDHEFFMRELGTTVNTMRNQEDASDREVVSKQFREVRLSVVEIQARLAKHNDLEENHVYKWVNFLLDETERSALMAQMRRQLENTPPRFSSDQKG
jgi:hemerythrin superfamily protein